MSRRPRIADAPDARAPQAAEAPGAAKASTARRSGRRPVKGDRGSGRPWQWARNIVALGLGALPIFLVLWFRDAAGVVRLPDMLAEKASGYAPALERLETASQSLVTICLSMIAGAAYLASRPRAAGKAFAVTLAYLVFILSVISVYFAIRLGYFSAATQAVESYDIVGLLSYLDYQGIFALLAASLLAALAMSMGLANEK